MSRRTLLGSIAVLATLACRSAGEARSLPKPPPSAKAEACPGMGTGFVRIAGSDTCIHVSGSVRVEAARQSGGSAFSPQGH